MTVDKMTKNNGRLLRLDRNRPLPKQSDIMVIRVISMQKARKVFCKCICKLTFLYRYHDNMTFTVDTGVTKSTFTLKNKLYSPPKPKGSDCLLEK